METSRSTATAVAEPPAEAREGRAQERPTRRDDQAPGRFPSDEELAAETPEGVKFKPTVREDKLYIRDLQRMEVEELHELAKAEGIEDYAGLKKQDLIFRILRSRIRKTGLLFGEGVL